MSSLLPLLGQFTAFFLFYSACPGLVKDRRTKRLTVDPIPFPIALTSTLLWIIYGLVIQDVWIFTGNFVGLAATSFNTVTVLRLSKDERTVRLLETFTVGGLILVGAIAALSTSPMFIADAALRCSIGGCACIFIVLVMFASPTLAAVKSLRSGDASQVSLPLSVAQLANGLLWGAYGAAQGNLVVMGPNSFGAVLAVINLLAKMRSCCGRQRAAAAVSAKSIGTKQIVQGGGEVLLRSMFHSGYVHLAPQDGILDSEEGMEIGVDNDVAAVLSDGAVGSVLRIVPVPAPSDGCDTARIALQAVDGRFLCVQARPSSIPGSAFVPSNFRVVAMHRAEAGPEGEFIPVYGKTLETDPVLAKYVPADLPVATHAYREENVGFWNPMHRVFVRANEAGGMDCSPEVRSTPSVGVVIPAGWEWERFTLHPVRQHESDDGLRRRVAVIGLSNSASTAA